MYWLTNDGVSVTDADGASSARTEEARRMMAEQNNNVVLRFMAELGGVVA